MEEVNHTPFVEIFAIVIERHSLIEWIFLFGFFVICQFFIGKSKNIGNIFLSFSGEREENFFTSLIVGFVGIYAASAFLCVLIILMAFVVKLISVSSGYVLPPINLMNLTLECSFIWAVIACGYVRSQEKHEYIAEISYLKERLAKVAVHEKS